MDEIIAPIPILMADDEPNDRLLTQEALTESRLRNTTSFVEDGEELLEYLHQDLRYAEPVAAPRPGLVLLDLNMPRKDGCEALEEIKSNPALRAMPVAILTTSKPEQDVSNTYDSGVNSSIAKPVSFDGLVEVVQSLGRYWFSIVELPSGREPIISVPNKGSPDPLTT